VLFITYTKPVETNNNAALVQDDYWDLIEEIAQVYGAANWE
jgi:hypothetical protein